jgi:heat shock protein beta
MISENRNELLPKYLSFVTGVVDSNELPLNVNR